MLPEYYKDPQFLEVYDLLLQFADVAGEVGCPPSSGDYAEYTLRILSVFREPKAETENNLDKFQSAWLKAMDAMFIPTFEIREKVEKAKRQVIKVLDEIRQEHKG